MHVDFVSTDTQLHFYLLSATRAGEGQRGVFGPLRLSFNVPSFVQQDLHDTDVTRGGSQDQGSEPCGHTHSDT